MSDNHQTAIDQAMNYIQQEKEKVNRDPWRLVYHVSAMANWMNDPNGFSYYNGEYHLFYQHHPFSPEWGPMYWGHAKSKNLAHWEHLPIALAPSEDYDQDGCFSGSAIEKDGKLYLMYTGNTWTGEDRDTDLKQVQCIAVSDDGVHFKKISDNPVISSAPEGDIHPFHFRDPKVWEYEGVYYCVLGSRTIEHKGQALLYRSKDLLEWEFVNIALKGEGNVAGFMWECPDIFRLEGKDVLVMSPQGMKPEGELYHNLHQAGYLLGELNYQDGTMKHDKFQLLDYGFDFYAPQTTIDDQGRRIMIAWMAMWESEMPEQKRGWAGAMTIPRQLVLKEDIIYSIPVEELKELRTGEVSYENQPVEGEKEFSGVEGDCFELEMIIDTNSADQFGVKLRKDDNLNQSTILSFDRNSGLVELNRNSSGDGPGGVRKAPVRLHENKLKLHLFVDKSSVEVFINDGEQVMSARIYPGEESKGISIFSEDSIVVESLKKWTIKSAF
ncbi:glycoside hydrolase family 32 protein [Litchfieldia alkalitelluris]|uniref:glycoside hydrolase family 32 protein n=1 Tax=Litchfieldia alkalitelluris TaxID=304268 RepID=UPI0009980B59|nr:glycoside hydrolase family 32 protein [Litchfieldia alkalitelluris]